MNYDSLQEEFDLCEFFNADIADGCCTALGKKDCAAIIFDSFAELLEEM